jgi:Arc/MetJ-type ribon-helix-helix transcriptional regulator
MRTLPSLSLLAKSLAHRILPITPLQEQQLIKEMKLAELRREIQKGKESAPPKELDIEDVIRRGKQRLAKQSDA